MARAALAAVVVLVAACGDDGGGDDGEATAEGDGAGEAAAEPFYGGHVSELYVDDANWLCKPGIADDVCARDLDATAVFADGTTEVQPHEAAEDPPVDCFYVYPTVSTDQEPNSDLEVAESEEVLTTVNQVARLSSTCRVFAPVYRQLTLSMIGESPEGVNPWETAYEDVIDAFRHYIDNENEGRGFVLIGHSQGAAHLNQLIAEEIDDQPELRERMVSAYLLGWALAVPEDDVVGGDFGNVPLCEAPDQVGCAVSYASFRSTAPPPENSIFGRPRDEEGIAACVNPASPADGGPAFLQPYFQVEVPENGLIGGASAQPFADPERTAEITTPFVTYPELVEGECVQEGGFSYLSLTVHGDPGDERTDDIGGDLTPEWGMHLVDANVAMGDLADMVAAQAEVYAG